VDPKEEVFEYMEGCEFVCRRVVCCCLMMMMMNVLLVNTILLLKVEGISSAVRTREPSYGNNENTKNQIKIHNDDLSDSNSPLVVQIGIPLR